MTVEVLLQSMADRFQLDLVSEIALVSMRRVHSVASVRIT